MSEKTGHLLQNAETDAFSDNLSRERPVRTESQDFRVEATPTAGLCTQQVPAGYFFGGFVAPLSSTARIGMLALVDQAVVSGTNFLTMAIIGRSCGADALGMYALGFTLVVLIACGQNALVSTPYTAYRGRLQPGSQTVYAGSVLVHFCLLATMAVLGLTLLAAVLQWVSGLHGLAVVLWVLTSMMPLILLREFFRRLGFAHLRVSTVLIQDLVVAVLQLGGLLVLAFAGVLSAGAAYAVTGLSCAVAAAVWFTLTRMSFVVQRGKIAGHLRQNWQFGRWVFAAMMALLIHLNMIPWLLAILLGVAATGFFAACMSVVALANPFVQGVSNVLFPRSALAFAKGGGAALHRVVWKATGALGLAMTTFCGVVILFGEEILTLLYGRDYAGHRAILTVLVLAVLVRALSIAAYDGLQAVERADVNFGINLLGLGITTVLTLGLIQPLGILGAAWALLAGDLAAAAARWVAFVRLVSAMPQTVSNT